MHKLSEEGQLPATRARARSRSLRSLAVGASLTWPAMSTIRLLSPLLVAGAVIIVRIIRRRRSALLVNGVTLPFEIVGPSSGRVCVVVGHGLGSSDPSAKSHADDASRPVLVPAVEAAGVRAVWYTARGHGASTGWEGGDPAQFSWPALASDMLLSLIHI